MARLKFDTKADLTSQVVAYDIDSNRTFSIKGILVERHLDADGSATMWLQVSEN